MSSSYTPVPALVDLPEGWRSSVQSQLSPHENVLAWLEVDLNAQLHFERSLLIVTDQRLFSGSQAPDRSVAWSEWTLVSGRTLTHHDHAGVGHLALVDEQQRLAQWRFTLGHNVLAMRLQEVWNAREALLRSGQPMVELETPRCPQCKLPLENPGDPCAVCTREVHTPPSTWGLFRLWRFAKPYKKQLLTGFLLTLASTAATLVPPYMTMPLMDEVLIPFQNGKQIETQVVAMYLGGLFVAALLAWGLG